jgi:hypothetical protein
MLNYDCSNSEGTIDFSLSLVKLPYGIKKTVLIIIPYVV